MQSPPPALLEIRPSVLGLPVIANNIVVAAAGLPRKSVQHLVRGFSGIERQDKRLKNGSRAIIGPRIAP